MRANRPQWWVLYSFIGIFLVLFRIEARLPVSETGHAGLEIGLIVVLFALLFIWVRANSARIGL